MDVPELGQEARVIYCPNCRRPLRALRTPRCNWCGSPIPAEAFQAIAAQAQHVMAQPDPPPLPPITSYMQRAEWGPRRSWGLFSLLNGPVLRPMTSGQSRLRTGILTVIGAAALAKLAYAVYALWMMHQAIRMLPRH